MTDFEGEYVKDADKHIIKKMKADGRLVMIQQILKTVVVYICFFITQPPYKKHMHTTKS